MSHPAPSRRRLTTSLTPDGPPPAPGAQWCPTCRNWTLREVLHVQPPHTYVNVLGEAVTLKGYTIYKPKRKRCAACQTALVRPPKVLKPKKGELRPGVVAMW